jgi:hypothetical protein
MLNLYDTAMNPGATVVRLLTGKRPLAADTHVRIRGTQSHLLHLVESVDELAGCAEEECRTEHDLSVA